MVKSSCATGTIGFTDVISFQLQKPEPLPLWMNTFQPFTSHVWLSIVTTMLSCCVFVYISSRCGLFDNIDPFLLFYILCEQSKRDTHLVKSDGLRLFLIFYVMSLYVITTGYKGALVSCLAIPVVPLPIGGLWNLCFLVSATAVVRHFRYI